MSKLVNCKACGKEVAKGSKCPHCGKDQRNFFMKHKIITIILGLIILGSIGSGLAGKDQKATETNSANQTTSTQPKKEEPKKDNKKYSYDKFLQVQMGMTYDQVKSILGDGTEESSVGEGEMRTVSYRWQNDDGGNMSVMFQGGKARNKAQAFLQSMDAKVTLDQYNKISNGMTYEQVKSILGEGQIMSQGEMLGTKSEIYQWINKYGSNMSVTFQNGKVQGKAQFQLN